MKQVLHIMALCSILSAPCYALDYKSFIDSLGKISPVLLDNAVRDVVEKTNDLDKKKVPYSVFSTSMPYVLTTDSASANYANYGTTEGLYLRKSSATLNYANYGTTDGLYLRKSSATSEIAYLAGARVFAGKTSLGTGNMGIKVKYLTGTCGATEGSVAVVAHGLTAANIMQVMVMVEHTAGQYVCPGYTNVGEYEYYWSSDGTNISLELSPTNSGQLVNDTFRVVIIYTE